jgi:molybdenum cofactor biosynthesis protein B
MSAPEHRAAASHQSQVRCAILTVSDTRDAATDRGGPKARELLTACGHIVQKTVIVRDEPEEIRAAIKGFLSDPQIDAIITTGGTGIAQRDRTADVVRELLTFELPGFGELFRMLSWQEVGSAAMLSRAIGGLAYRPNFPPNRDQGVFIFALPGSVTAVELAITRLIGPELGHLTWERRKSGNPTA